MTDTWIRACAATDLPIGAARVVKGEHLGRSYQIALFHTDADRYFATDNLCPHEGYPLVQGYVKDCVLTCAWHNFKFGLEDGHCIKGDEAVTTHPVRVHGDTIEFQVANADQQIDVEKTLASLSEGLLEDQMARVARDVVRLLRSDVPASALILAAARFDAERAEWGTTHALPVAAIALRIADRHTGLAAALPIMQVMECAAEPNTRRPIRPLAAAITPTADAESTGNEIGALIEAENYARAEGLLRGGLARGWRREDIEPWFLSLCCDHFLGFGHALIYTTKAFDLLDTVGFDYAPHLLPALLFRIANSTREDTLPPMRFLRDRLDELESRFEDWMANTSADRNRDQVVASILDGSKHDACAAVAEALDDGATPQQIVDALSDAASNRLLRFDPAHADSDEVQEGWLDVTHCLTFANAIRKTLDRHSKVEVIRLLFFGAHFIQRTKPLDRAEAVHEPKVGVPPTVAQICEQILAGNSTRAVAMTRSYLRSNGDIDALRIACEDIAIGDHLTRPIIVAHAIKTCVAAFEEYAELGNDPIPILALIHFVASPMRERAIGRNVHEAIRFIAGGKPPRRLTL